MRQCVSGALLLLLLSGQTCVPIPISPDGLIGLPDEDFETELVTDLVEDTELSTDIRYVLTVNIVGDGEVMGYDPSAGFFALADSYDPGTELRLSARTPPKGWSFSHWEGAIPDGNKFGIDVLMDSDKEITAVYVETAIVHSEVVGGGAINSPTGSPLFGEVWYPIGSEVTLIAAPDDGWRFVRWEKRTGTRPDYYVIWSDEGETLTDAAQTLTVVGHVKFTAVFEEDLTPIYTQQEVSYFLSIRWETLNIAKWGRDIRLTTSGSPTSADMIELLEIVNEINSTFESAGTTVRMSLDSPNPNFEIIFEPVEGVANAGFATWGGDYWPEVDWAEVRIESQDITQETRNTVLRHEIMHTLGFLHSQNTSSIMFPTITDVGSQQTFPSIDRIAIEILYNPRLWIGMPMADALAALDPLVIGGTGSISARVLPSVVAEDGFCGCSQ